MDQDEDVEGDDDLVEEDEAEPDWRPLTAAERLRIDRTLLAYALKNPGALGKRFKVEHPGFAALLADYKRGVPAEELVVDPRAAWTELPYWIEFDRKRGIGVQNGVQMSLFGEKSDGR